MRKHIQAIENSKAMVQVDWQRKKVLVDHNMSKSKPVVNNKRKIEFENQILLKKIASAD